MTDSRKEVIPAFKAFAAQSLLLESKRRQDEIIRGVIKQLPPKLPSGDYVITRDEPESLNPMADAFARFGARFSDRPESAELAHTKGTSARGKD